MFNDSKYTRYYFLIISRAQIRQSGDEVHHILPVSMGGSNDKRNLVKLTLREHFVVHRLLTKMPVDKTMRWKMHYALSCFTTRKKRISSRHFELACRAAKTVDRTGNGLGRKMSDETKRKLSEANTGRVVSDETKKKQSATIKKLISSGDIKRPRREDSKTLSDRYYALGMAEKTANGRRASSVWRESVSSEASRERRRENSPKRTPILIDGVQYSSIRHAANSLGVSYSKLRWRLLHPQEQGLPPASTHRSEP